MHQIVSNPVDSSRRWWVLAIVVSAQFMFGVDAFIVNVAMPTMAVELRASAAQIEAVIAIYLIAYATLVVSGGRLGDIYGTKNVFIAGVSGFTVTSLWCGLAQSGPELILARLAQGATAALMVPQVLATLHLLFVDSSRARAFGIYGIVLGLAGAAGFMLGGLLVTLDLAGLGWRAVFFVNVPFGADHHRRGVEDRADSAPPRRHAARHSRRDRAVRGIAVPDRPAAVRPRFALVISGLAGDGRGGRDHRRLPAARTRGRASRRHAADRSFAVVRCSLHARADRRVLFLLRQFVVLSGHDDVHAEGAAYSTTLQAGLVFVPLALTFVIASRHSGVRAKHRGTLVLIEGCVVQIVGLAMLAAAVACTVAPSASLLALLLTVFGYGQGLVMAPLSSAVLSTVKPASAGAGSGMYGTTTQIANAAGVAAIGAVFFAIEAAGSPRLALYAACALFALSIIICGIFLSWMRRAAD